MTIQAVFFDMGGTIETCWSDDEVRLAATPGLRDILLHAGIDLRCSDGQLCQIVSTGLERYRSWKNRTNLELPPQRVWSEFILFDYVYAVDASRLAAAAESLMLWIETRYYRRAMRPEMPAVAQAIRAMGLKLGVISNTCSRGQVGRNLEQYGLRQFVEPVVLSCEYGRRKPDPAIFHYAARLADVPASACAYVGDSLAKDIEGACRAGYRFAFQIRNEFRRAPEVPILVRPDAVVSRLDELLPFLSAGRQRTPRNPPRGAGDQARGILFDAGDVLYHRPDRGKQFAAFLAEVGHGATVVSAAQRETLKEQSVLGEIDQEEYRRALLRLHGVTDPVEIDRGLRILEAEDNEIRFVPGVKETLHTLKQRDFLLGIVTDTRFPVSVKLNWLAKGGFGDVWDTIISSNELGIRKPDPRIYQAALKQLGLSAGQAVFVGHNAAELAGAQAAGIRTIAYNHDQGARADFYVAEFADLLTLPVIAPDEMETTR